MESTIVSFNKGKDILPDESTLFNFQCPECSSENILLSPIDISYDSSGLKDHSDIKNHEIRRKTELLPYIQDALMACHDSIDKRIMIECKECNRASMMYNSPDRGRLRRHATKNYGKLGLVKNVTE